MSNQNAIFEQLAQAASAPLGKAKSLPFASYLDQSIYALEKQKIFHADWVFVCAEKELPNPGDYLSFFLADEPIIILRGKDNHLRALSNVCRHRGTLLKDSGMGNATKIVCPYHAWTYDYQGELLGAPFTQEDEINKRDHCLTEFRLEIWHGLIFVNLDNQAPSLSTKISGIDKYLHAYGFDRFTSVYSGAIENWNANWKLAMENAMESYHLFKVHRETLEKITPTRDAFYLEGFADWSLTAGKMEANGTGLLDWVLGSYDKHYDYYVLISIPPNFVGILTYESFDWISVLPISEKQCSVRSAGMNAHGGSGGKDEIQFVKAFFSEDKAICERVQSGMSAQLSQGGKLVELERIVVDFHHYLGKLLFSTKRPDKYISSLADKFIVDKND